MQWREEKAVDGASVSRSPLALSLVLSPLPGCWVSTSQPHRRGSLFRFSRERCRGAKEGGGFFFFFSMLLEASVLFALKCFPCFSTPLYRPRRRSCLFLPCPGPCRATLVGRKKGGEGGEKEGCCESGRKTFSARKKAVFFFRCEPRRTGRRGKKKTRPRPRPRRPRLSRSLYSSSLSSSFRRVLATLDLFSPLQCQNRRALSHSCARAKKNNENGMGTHGASPAEKKTKRKKRSSRGDQAGPRSLSPFLYSLSRSLARVWARAP